MKTSIWESVEFDAASRDFVYEDYVWAHNLWEVPQKPLSETAYKILVSCFEQQFLEDSHEQY